MILIGYIVFQIAAAYMQKTAVEGTIVNRVGVIYQSMEVAGIKAEIETILLDKKLTVVSIGVTKGANAVTISVTYEKEVNLLIKKSRRTVQFTRSIAVY